MAQEILSQPALGYRAALLVTALLSACLSEAPALLVDKQKREIDQLCNTFLFLTWDRKCSYWGHCGWRKTALSGLFGLVEATVSTRAHLLPYIFPRISVFSVCSFKDAGQNPFPWLKYQLYKNQIRNCSLIPTSFAVRICLKCGPVYLHLPLVSVISWSSRSCHFSVLSSLKTDRISIFSFAECLLDQPSCLSPLTNILLFAKSPSRKVFTCSWFSHMLLFFSLSLLWMFFLFWNFWGV